jgi:hypothetical protein
MHVYNVQVFLMIYFSFKLNMLIMNDSLAVIIKPTLGKRDFHGRHVVHLLSTQILPR